MQIEGNQRDNEGGDSGDDNCDGFKGELIGDSADKRRAREAADGKNRNEYQGICGFDSAVKDKTR